MNHEELHESIQSMGASVASAIDHRRDSVTPVGGAEAGHVMPDYPVSEPFPDDFNWPDDYEWPDDNMWPELASAAAGDNWPGEPDEAWCDDPDAHYREVVDYMKGLYAHCESSDEFIAALKSLFPDLEEKVARARALTAEDLGEDDIPDPDADIAAGRSIFYRSGAELMAASLATISDPGCA